MKAVIDLIKELGNKAATFLALVALALLWGYGQMRLYWSPLEIFTMVCVGPTVLLVVIFSIGKGRGIDLPTADDVKGWFGKGSEGSAAQDFDWVNAMTATYTPSRRSPALPVGIDGAGFSEVAMRGRDSHLLITGSTGSGKSSLVNQIILAANNSGIYQTIVYSLKPGDLAPVANLKNVHIVRYSETELERYADDMPRIIESITNEMHRRIARLTDLKRANVWELRASQRPPIILFVLEELGVTTGRIEMLGGKKAAEEFWTKIGEVARMGRAAGIALAVVNQDPVGIPTAFAKNMVAIPFKVRNKTDAYQATGRTGTGAEKIRANDETKGLPPEVIVATGAGDERRQIAYFTKQDIAKAIAMSDQSNIPFHGYPEWLYGYEPPEIAPETAVADGVRTITQDGTITANPADSTSSRETIGECIATAVADARQAMAEHPKLQGRSPAYSDDRTIGIWLGLVGGMEENPIMRMAFGNTNGRYRDYVKVVGEVVEDFYTGKEN